MDQRREIRFERLHLRDHDLVACLPQHQRVGEVVDVFGGTAEVNEVVQGGGLVAITEAFADKVLNRLDVMVGRRLDTFDLLGVVAAEIVDDAVQHVFQHRR